MAISKIALNKGQVPSLNQPKLERASKKYLWFWTLTLVVTLWFKRRAKWLSKLCYFLFGREMRGKTLPWSCLDHETSTQGQDGRIAIFISSGPWFSQGHCDSKEGQSVCQSYVTFCLVEKWGKKTLALVVPRPQDIRTRKRWTFHSYFAILH